MKCRHGLEKEWCGVCTQEEEYAKAFREKQEAEKKAKEQEESGE